MKRKLMKKQLTKFLTGSLLTLAACFIISTPVKASVKDFKTTQTSLKATADVTGDGKGDSIKIKYGLSSYDSISKFAIYINGKKVHTQKFTEPNDVFYLSATYAKMSNSKEFIQVIGYGPNDIKEFNTVYQFDAKKNVLNPVLDLNNNFGSADKITAADSKALVFALEAFATNLPVELAASLSNVMGTHIFIYEYAISWIYPLEYTTAKYVMLAIMIASFAISQILSSLIRKAKVNKISSLKQKVKRY